MKYDLEQLLSDLKAVCITNLNTKLAAITTEKGDSLSLPTISSDAYFFQRLDKNRVGPFKAFLFYAVEDPNADGIGPHTLEEYLINFIVALKDTADGEDFTTRLLRYSRALKEIFETACTQNKVRTKIVVSSLSPQAFSMQDVPGVFKGVGVQIKAVIG